MTLFLLAALAASAPAFDRAPDIRSVFAHPFQALGAALHAPDSARYATFLQGGGTPQSGEVVITEFMKDPTTVTDAKGEWFEVYNALPWRVNIEGWMITDDSGSHTTINVGGGGLRIRPGHYLVLGNNGDPTQNGGIPVDYVYSSSFVLGNGADQIMLVRPGGAIVDRVAYDAGVLWPSQPGRSISLKTAARNAILNDDPTMWCLSTTPISATNPDTGTPRFDNDACP